MWPFAQSIWTFIRHLHVAPDDQVKIEGGLVFLRKKVSLHKFVGTKYNSTTAFFFYVISLPLLWIEIETEIQLLVCMVDIAFFQSIWLALNEAKKIYIPDIVYAIANDTLLIIVYSLTDTGDIQSWFKATLVYKLDNLRPSSRSFWSGMSRVLGRVVD